MAHLAIQSQPLRLLAEEIESLFPEAALFIELRNSDRVTLYVHEWPPTSGNNKFEYPFAIFIPTSIFVRYEKLSQSERRSPNQHIAEKIGKSLANFLALGTSYRPTKSHYLIEFDEPGLGALV
jgi:hypothetical protein